MILFREKYLKTALPKFSAEYKMDGWIIDLTAFCQVEVVHSFSFSLVWTWFSFWSCPQLHAGVMPLCSRYTIKVGVKL